MTIVNVGRWVKMPIANAVMLLGTMILAAVTLAAQGGTADRAYNNGYQAGFKLGKADGHAGKPEDFAEVSTYRRATDGWKETDSGDLETYRTNFRAGYADGYKDGYKEARGGAPAKPPTPGRGGDRMILQPPASPSVSGEPQIATPLLALTVAEGTTLRLRLDNTISTRTSRQGDHFTATVSEPVYISGSSAIAIPVGSKVAGTITQVERPGRVKGTAQLHLRYETITLPGGPDLPLEASTSGVHDKDSSKVDQGEGSVKGKKSTGRDTAEVAGGSALGAIIGGIAGGGKGAGIGAAVGAGAGLGGVLVQRGKEIDLPSGTTVEVRLMRSLDLRR